ncbi:MAG: penicillin acylase family protein [Deltaproteobacteria bacterium]|nr:penicillin acylase family protein [Deltaproteobacteria bacterium]
MKALRIIIGIVVLLVSLTPLVKAEVNAIQRSGAITLNVLKEPVTIIRDEKGMPYIYAKSLADGITAQGFVTAQDRLTQLEVIRLISNGRYAELAGEKVIKQDIFFRSLGFFRHAQKHAKMLDEESRQFIQWYVNGINAYIEKMKHEYPYEMNLVKLEPSPWTVEDVLSVLYMIGFTSSGNYESELLFSKLFNKLGPNSAMGLSPINVGPDCNLSAADFSNAFKDVAGFGDISAGGMLSDIPAGEAFARVGSNNWAVAPKLTKNKAAILAGDPHLSTTSLPTTWYPTAIITPQYRMVGTTIPGAPGFYNLRTNYIAIGLTNSYIDCQDVYVEILDPNNPKNYLEGSQSVPFIVIPQTIKIRSEKELSGYKEIAYPVFLTKRGPVIFKTDKIAMTLRWSPVETMTSSLAIYDVIRAKSVEDVKKALQKETMQMFNRSFVDAKGNIGWHTTGRIPIRSQKSSAYPQAVKNGEDNWIGWIPFDEMPHGYNPPQGWTGTANNKTVGNDYPHYLSSEFASHYRFARLKEILSSSGNTTADDHWKYQWDTKNMLAERIAPVMASILSSFDDTIELGKALAQWDFYDDRGKSAPAIFQIVMIKSAYWTFKDELGEALAMEMLKDWYFWQVRFEKMILDGKSEWFDIKGTEEVETIKDIIHKAGLEAISQYGINPVWGDLHQIEIENSLITKGPLKSAAEGGKYSMSGSGETLYRAKYHFNHPFSAYYTASLRMVADMSDKDKVLAVLPGGVSGRISDKHYKDQLKAFMTGEKIYWWFSDKMIKAHTQSTLMLNAGK